MIPSAIGYYLGLKQGERQMQLVEEIQALGNGDLAKVESIADDRDDEHERAWEGHTDSK